MWRRCKSAVLCYYSAHFPGAHAQFQAVGDRLTTWPTFPFVPLETMKKIRDHTARIVTGKPPGGDAPQGEGPARSPD